MQIALELEPFKLSLLNNVDSMVRFIDDVDHPGRAGQHRRLAPAAGERAAGEKCARLKGKAIHVHISDCDGKVHGDLPPGRGVVDFEPYLKEIDDLGHRRRRFPSSWNTRRTRSHRRWVAEAYRETDRLMRQANLRG